MASYFNRQDREKKDLFDAPGGVDISSTKLDLPTKLTILFKRGYGQKYISTPKKTLDAPLEKKHQEYLKSQFTKATYDHYVRSTTLEVDRRKSYEDYSVMDYCCVGETKIATPTGFITIEELSKLGTDNEFMVYAYDHSRKQIVPAMARNAHQTQVAMTYKVTFDKGHFIGTPNHKLMMRDGSFKRIDELKSGDSMMPFYRKDNFYPERKYNHIYTCNPEVGRNGWISERRLVAEYTTNRKLNENEVVHLPFDDIIEVAKIEKTLKGTANVLGVSHPKIQSTIRSAGYEDWQTFLFAYGIEKNKYSTAKLLNGSPSQLPKNRKRTQPNVWDHTVVSVEPHGIVPVYDLTVPGFKNFATDTVMSHNTPEISSALDIYSDECLTKSEQKKVLTITCENERIRKILDSLFNDILDIDHNLWQWTRQMCKYGNHFLLLDVQPNKGVSGFLPIPTEEIRREEAYDGDVNSVKFIWDAQNLMFDSWQIAHFRVLSNMAKFPYGTSQLESARLIWKQLQLAEDAMLIYRITRAPERRVFYIDVGNIEPEAVDQYIKDIKNAVKRTPMVNQGTGNMDYKYNPMAVDEDFFIPRRNDKNSQIETLPGASNLDQIGDIEYLQAKLFAALKIPKAYLTFDDKINAKATLSSEDFRFARTINRIQQALVATLTNVAVIHLYSMGLRDKEHLTGFELELTNPSTQTDLEKMEILSSKAGAFTQLWNEQTLSPISYVWGMQNIFNMSEDEIKTILKQQFLEGKMKLDIEVAGKTDPLTMMGMDEDGNPLGMEAQMEMQAQMDGGEGGQPAFTDQNGNPLPDQPEDGQAYVDSKTGEAIDETISKLIETLSKTKIKKPIKKNRPLNENSLSYDNTLKMLSTIDENIGKPPKKIDAKRVGVIL